MLVQCAKCGEAVDKETTRGTLLENVRVCLAPCSPPEDTLGHTLKQAARLTEDYWEGRYYLLEKDRERLAGEDLAEMLDKLVELVKRRGA